MKQGYSAWSTTPPARGFVVDDVAEAVRVHTDTVAVVGSGGLGSIASWTVDYDAGVPSRSVALVDLANGSRTIAVANDPDTAIALLSRDSIGRSVTVSDDGAFDVD
jgi:hypothetical protein